MKKFKIVQITYYTKNRQLFASYVWRNSRWVQIAGRLPIWLDRTPLN